MIEKSENIANLASALLKAQKAIGKALKNAENTFFGQKYADLEAVIEAVKGPLNQEGICFLQAVNMGADGKGVVETVLLHENGQFISSCTPVYCSKPNDPQAFGSGISYSKRYGLQALLGLPTVDDDGQMAAAEEMTNEAREVLRDAYAEFKELYTKELKTGMRIDAHLFKAAVLALNHGVWPTKAASSTKIAKAIDPKEVMKEAK